MTNRTIHHPAELGPRGTRNQRPVRVSRVLLLAVAAVMVVTGCTTDPPGTAPAPSESGAPSVGKQLTGERGTVEDLTLSPEQVAAATAAGAGGTIGILAPLSAEYLANVVDGAKESAEAIGMKTQVVDYQFDAAKGVSGIESMVSQGIKYMVVVLTDPPAMIGAVQAAQAAGVTVVQFAGAQVAEEAGGYSVAIDDKELGTAAGEAAAVIAKDRGAVEIAILDFPSQPNVVIRADAMEAAIKAGAPEAKIVARVPGGTQEIGLKASESLLQKYPKLGGVVSVNDAGGYGAVQAFEAAKRTGDTAFVVGCDAESKAVEQINAGGVFKATVDTQPKLTGQTAVDVIGNLLSGSDVAQYTSVPVKTVTKS